MIKRSHTIYAAALLALSAAAFTPAIATAQVGVSVIIGQAPPPIANTGYRFGRPTCASTRPS